MTRRSIPVLALLFAVSVVFMYGCGGGGGASSDGAALTDTAPGVADTGDAPEIRFSEPGAADVQQGAAVASAMVVGAPPPQGASAIGTINTWYVPSNAFDGDYKSWWVGEVSRGSWDLYYAFPAARTLDQISINFYGNDYVPGTVALKLSTDGVTWTDSGTFAAGSSKPALAVTGQWRYIWIDMDGNPAIGYPLIREVDWLPVAGNTGVSGGPGANEDWYFPTNAFDGDMNTWWVGKQGAGSWDLYYVFDSPQFIQMLSMTFYNINYIPAATTLQGSADGYAWTDLGALGPGPNTTPYTGYFHIGQSVSYLRIHMQGNPPSTFPLVKDISFTYPDGASSADSKDTFYKAANAFDGKPDTWWVGDPNKTGWDLFYAVPSDTYYTQAAVSFYSVNHAPAATTLYTSLDGQSWALAGTFPAGASPVLSFGHAARFLKFRFQGAPAVGYPLVKDISLQTGSATWEKVWGRADRNERAWTVRPAPGGGYFVGGWTEWYSSGVPNYHDVVTMKLDAQGNEIWQKYTTVAGDSGLSYNLTPSADGGCLVSIWGSSAGLTNPWLVKLDANGNEQWRKSYPGESYSDYIISIKQTLDGGYVFTGSFDYQDSRRTNGKIVKITADGTVQWARDFGGDGVDYFRAIVEVPASDTRVDDEQTVTQDAGGFVAVGNTTTGVSGDYGWIVRVDKDGNELWSRTVGNGSTEFHTLTSTRDGAYVAAGYTGGSHLDFYTYKFDDSGTMLWQRLDGGSLQDQAYGIDEGPDGSVVVVGAAKSYGIGNTFAHMAVKIDASGALVWQKTFCEEEGGQARSVAIGADGGMVVVGESAILSSAWDVYIRKMDADGNCANCIY